MYLSFNSDKNSNSDNKISKMQTKLFALLCSHMAMHLQNIS